MRHARSCAFWMLLLWLRLALRCGMAVKGVTDLPDGDLTVATSVSWTPLLSSG